MTTAEIEVSLRDIFAEHFPDRTCTEDSFSDLDSVQRLTLVVALEDHFEVCFDPEEENGLVSLEDVVRYLHKELAAS